MNSMKRFASLLLALVMLFALATTAFAANPGSITVLNPMQGQSYTAYKIFDVTYNTSKSAASYTISTSSDWYTVVKDYSGLTLTAVANDPDLFTVTTKAGFSAAAFSEHLKTHTFGKTGIALTLSEDGQTASASDLELGYYFVTSTTGALCNLTTITPAASIRDKNDVPFTKTDDATTVAVGETIHYTLTGKVPDTTGFETYTYKITDQMSAGLTFRKDVTLTIGGAAVDAANYDLTDNDDGFELTIKVKNLQDQVGQEIKVTYSAVTNDAAIAQISKNTAKLVYSNDPTQTDKTTEITKEETVYSAKIVVDKHETGKEAVKLSGAEFVLKNAAGQYYKHADNKVEWVTDKADATKVTTDANGAAEFGGLKDGNYKLEELKAPAGYNLLTSDVDVTIDGSTATEGNLTPLTATANVANSTGTTLPETGGVGTTLFYVFGSLLVLSAAVLLVVKKRMSFSK